MKDTAVISRDRIILNVALTGMVPMKAQNAALPVTADEIADDIVRCADAGGGIFHIHARDEQGAPTHSAAAYAAIMDAVRARTRQPLVLCVSTSGRVLNTFATRSEVLGLTGPLKPQMGSLTLGSMNFPTQASVNTPEMIQALAARMLEAGIRPELEIFEGGMIDYSRYLLDRAVLVPPLYYNLLLGSLGTLAATQANLDFLVSLLPEGATWAATGIGRFQWPVHRMAIEMGGHIRVGLEDALFMDAEKKDPATNLRLVERAVAFARSCGRTPASPEEIRSALALT